MPGSLGQINRANHRPLRCSHGTRISSDLHRPCVESSNCWSRHAGTTTGAGKPGREQGLGRAGAYACVPTNAVHVFIFSLPPASCPLFFYKLKTHFYAAPPSFSSERKNIKADRQIHCPVSRLSTSPYGPKEPPTNTNWPLNHVPVGSHKGAVQTTAQHKVQLWWSALRHPHK